MKDLTSYTKTKTSMTFYKERSPRLVRSCGENREG